jgi:hypothetical protein
MSRKIFYGDVCAGCSCLVFLGDWIDFLEAAPGKKNFFRPTQRVNFHSDQFPRNCSEKNYARNSELVFSESSAALLLIDFLKLLPWGYNSLVSGISGVGVQGVKK